MAAPLVVVNGPIILAGQSLSSPIDCTTGALVRLTMPASWTPANLSFQISSDGNGYNDLYRFHDGALVEVTVAVVEGVGILLDIGQLNFGLAFIKFRSGTSRHPVIQAAQRDFSVALQP